MPALPDNTTLSYGSFTFPVTTETKVDIQPVMDSANRSLKYNSYILTARCRFGGGTSSAANNLTLPGILRALVQEGQTLLYLNKGLGDLRINTGADANDVVWGPTPKMVSWAPLGNNACDFTWRVEFHLSNCANPNYGGILSLVFSQSFSHDTHGYTTRTYSGTLEIPRWKSVSGYPASFDRTPDSYLERVIPAVPDGYRLVNATHSVDESKTRLSFSVTHEEVTNPLPVGIVEASVSHSTQNTNPPALVQWSSTLSAGYTVAKGVPRSEPLKCFLALLKDRLDEERKITDKNTYPIIMSINISEPEVHGKRSFQGSVTWLTNRREKMGGWLVESLWRPVPGTDGTLWRKSLENTAWHPRGLSRVTDDPRQDVVVSLCDSSAGSTTSLVGGKVVPKPGTASLTNKKVTLTPGLQQLMTQPAASESFLRLIVSVTIEPVQQTAVHMPLPIRSQKATLSNQPATTQDQQGAQQPESSTPRPVVQFRGSPLVYLRLTGTVIRIGFPVEAPSIVSFMGVPVADVTDGNRGEGVTYTDNNDGVNTIYRADWNLRYVLSELPASNAMYPPDSKDSILTRVQMQNQLRTMRKPPIGGGNTGGPP